MEYYTAANKQQLHTSPWVTPRNTILSEKRKVQNETYNIKFKVIKNKYTYSV